MGLSSAKPFIHIICANLPIRVCKCQRFLRIFLNLFYVCTNFGHFPNTAGGLPTPRHGTITALLIFLIFSMKGQSGRTSVIAPTSESKPDARPPTPPSQGREGGKLLTKGRLCYTEGYSQFRSSRCCGDGREVFTTLGISHISIPYSGISMERS